MSENYDNTDINAIQQENLELLQKSMVDHEEIIESETSHEEVQVETLLSLMH